MRLFAYACTHTDPPVQRGLLPLTDLTILLGPNDSGKSSWLRAVERDLRGGYQPQTDDRRQGRIAGVFYAHLMAGELAKLLDEARHLRAAARVDRRWAGMRPPYDDGLWHPDHETSRDLSFPGSSDVAQQLIDALKTKAPERAPLLDALASSDIVAFEPAGVHSGRPLWNVYWCLPALEELPDEVAEKVRSSSLRFFEDDRRRSLGAFVPMRGPYGFAYPRPDHLRVDGAPVAVVSIGQSRYFPMPTGLAVPAAIEAIYDAVQSAVTRLSEAARYGLHDASYDEPLPERERCRREPPSGWLDQDENSYRVAPDVVAACTFIRAAANRLLPQFVADRYELIVETRPVEQWFDDGPLRLMIRPRADERSEFELDQVADGLRLWLQLALLEATEQTGRVRLYLQELASDWFGQAQAVNDAVQHDDPDASKFSELADEHAEQFDDAVQALRDISDNGWVIGDLRRRLELRPAEDVITREVQDRRLFVVDEPERHLHPGLQREAARWLSDTAAERAAPALLATHSTAFLSLPASDGLSYLYCSRSLDDGMSTVRLFTPAELLDLDQVSAEMGFDPGSC